MQARQGAAAANVSTANAISCDAAVAVLLPVAAGSVHKFTGADACIGFTPTSGAPAAAVAQPPATTVVEKYVLLARAHRPPKGAKLPLEEMEKALKIALKHAECVAACIAGSCTLAVIVDESSAARLLVSHDFKDWGWHSEQSRDTVGRVIDRSPRVVAQHTVATHVPVASRAVGVAAECTLGKPPAHEAPSTVRRPGGDSTAYRRPLCALIIFVLPSCIVFAEKIAVRTAVPATFASTCGPSPAIAAAPSASGSSKDADSASGRSRAVHAPRASAFEPGAATAPAAPSFRVSREGNTKAVRLSKLVRPPDEFTDAPFLRKLRFGLHKQLGGGALQRLGYACLHCPFQLEKLDDVAALISALYRSCCTTFIASFFAANRDRLGDRYLARMMDKAWPIDATIAGVAIVVAFAQGRKMNVLVAGAANGRGLQGLLPHWLRMIDPVPQVSVIPGLAVLENACDGVAPFPRPVGESGIVPTHLVCGDAASVEQALRHNVYDLVSVLQRVGCLFLLKRFFHVRTRSRQLRLPLFTPTSPLPHFLQRSL